MFFEAAIAGINFDKNKNRSIFCVLFCNYIFNKHTTMGLSGGGGCCLRADGQEMESFLKAIFRNMSAGRISAIFPHRFHNYARKLLSEDTQRSDTQN